MTAAVRALWAFAALVLLGGGFALERTYERSIENSKAQIEMLYRHTVVNERTIARVAELRAAQTAAEMDLRRTTANASLPAATAVLLQTLHDGALHKHTQIWGVETGRTLVQNRLLATDLTLHVRGHFPNIVRFVEDVSQHTVLVKVSSTDLALASQAPAGREPDLDASVHAILYRVQDEEEGKGRIASVP